MLVGPAAALEATCTEGGASRSAGGSGAGSAAPCSAASAPTAGVVAGRTPPRAWTRLRRWSTVQPAKSPERSRPSSMARRRIARARWRSPWPRDMASGGGYLKAEKRRATWSSKRLQHPRRMPGLCMRTHVCYTTTWCLHAAAVTSSSGRGTKVVAPCTTRSSLAHNAQQQFHVFHTASLLPTAAFRRL